MSLRSNIFTEKAIIILLLCLSAALNVFLGFEVKKLRNVLSLIENERVEDKIILGKTVSPLNVKSLDGESTTLTYNNTGLPTILYVFSPDCVWCERNLLNIKYLYDNRQNQYRFVGLSIDKKSASEYVKQEEISFPVFFNPSDLNRLEYNLRSTAATYIISPEGKIIKFLSGAYTEKTLLDIEGFFGIKLPGISD